MLINLSRVGDTASAVIGNPDSGLRHIYDYHKKHIQMKLTTIAHLIKVVGHPKTSLLTAGATLFLFSTGSLQAATTYHVRPYTTVIPGAISDGLIENGATSNSLTFSDASKTARASADLASGQLKAYAGINNSIAGALALAEFSETFTLRSGSGTTFDFNFDFDGTLTADAKSVITTSPYQISFTANLAVFNGGEADWNTWFNQAYVDQTALFADSFQFSANDPETDINEVFNESLSFSTLLDSDFEQFQVFARIQMFVNGSGSPQTAAFDFLNTGTLGFTADPSVEVSSASGVFPGSQPPQSVPDGGTSLALLGISLGGLAWTRRKLA